METVRMMPKDRAYLTLALICRAFQRDTRLSLDDLMQIHEEWIDVDPDSDPGGDRLADLIQELEGVGLAMDDIDYVIQISELPTALCVMYFDQRLRHPGNIMANLTALLDLMPRKRSISG